MKLHELALSWNNRSCSGNNWGRDANGTICLGCGEQEEFYGCADIAIDNSTQPPRSSVNRARVYSTPIPVTGPHRTIDSPPRTTAVIHPIHAQGASPAETTTTAAAGPARELGDAIEPETTVSSASFLRTQPVIQFAGQQYDVVIHSSV